MTLTFEQIRQITVGAVRMEECDDGIHFYKCTQKQIDAWTRENKTLGERAAGSTGVRLDFHTTSQSMTFRVSRGFKFELYVNDLLRAQYKMSETPEVTVALDDPLANPLAEKRVTLYFPSHDCGGVLQSLELDDGATVTPHKFDLKMLFIGDSITQGWASDFDSLSYAYRTSRFFNAESVIQGIGGAYYCEDTFDHINFDPDAVLVAYGTNDFGHYKTLDELRGHVAAHLGLLREEYRDKKFFVISPIWRDQRDGKAMGSFEECRAVVAKEAQKLGLCHIDGLTLVPPMPVFFQDEYLHPNDNGFSLYAENLIMQLRKYL